MSWIKELFDGLATILGKPPAVQELKYKERLQRKRHNKLLKNQFNQIFSSSSVEELQLFYLLFTSNNMPQKVSYTCEFEYDYDVEINDNDEKVFQIIQQSDPYSYRAGNKNELLNDIVRINPCVWPMFLKEFKKHGIQRLNNIELKNLNFEYRE